MLVGVLCIGDLDLHGKISCVNVYEGYLLDSVCRTCVTRNTLTYCTVVDSNVTVTVFRRNRIQREVTAFQTASARVTRFTVLRCQFSGILAVLCFGNCRRYLEILDFNALVFCVGKDILIVDDICSYGGTFLHSAKKLKEFGANKIYLYVSHCENSILKGQLMSSGLIERVFTTNSIFTESHERIEVFV